MKRVFAPMFRCSTLSSEVRILMGSQKYWVKDLKVQFHASTELRLLHIGERFVGNFNIFKDLEMLLVATNRLMRIHIFMLLLFWSK